MKRSMSSARVRNVWKRTTSVIAQPAAVSTARTFSKACFVWRAASLGPTIPPSRSAPTWPATTTSSPVGTMMPWEYIPNVGPSSGDVMALGGMVAASVQPDVLDLGGLPVDAARGRRDPVRELPPLHHRLHEALHVGPIGLRGQPFVVARVPLRLADHLPGRRHADVREPADGAMEGPVRQ